MNELALLRVLAEAIRTAATRPAEGTERPGRLRGDAGYTTEAVIVIAGLAALALVVVGIIVLKVKAAAENIPTS